jgi:hypothetical protein
MKRILLIEDDPVQAETFANRIAEYFPGRKVVSFESESEFYDFVNQEYVKLTTNFDLMVDAVIADVMIPWTLPSPGASPPPDNVVKEGHTRAGIRCLALFREKFGDKTPWVLFSILPSDWLREAAANSVNTFIVNKEQSFEDLVKAVTSAGVPDGGA